MVRLKRGPRVTWKNQHFSFNSIMVRLKPLTVAPQKETSSFQFHYGSIKTENVDTVQKNISSFNSIMVRLKQIFLMQQGNF